MADAEHPESLNQSNTPTAAPRKAKRVLVGGLVCLVGLIIFGIAVQRSKILYSRYFGTHLLEISLGSEFDIHKTEHRILKASYYDPPRLMIPFHSFRIPESARPTFATVEDVDLICVYDTNNLGFLMMVDKQTHDWYATYPDAIRGSGVYWSDFSVWLNNFRLLKSRHPDLPYEERFQEWAKRLEK